MAILPKKLEFLRNRIYKIRKLLWKVLGVQDPDGLVMQLGNLSPQSLVDEQMMRFWDRLNIMESHVNWRLYGLPPRLVNIKLEQTQLLAGSGDVEDALDSFKQQLTSPTIPDFLIEATSQAKSIFMFPGDNNHEWKGIQASLSSEAKITLIDDSSDLFRYEEDSELQENDTTCVLRVSATDAAARLLQPEFDCVWLSSTLERVSTLQAHVILKRVQSSLLDGGMCAGTFQIFSSESPGAYWADPRRNRPLDTEYLRLLAEGAGFKSISFEESTSEPKCVFYKLLTT